jgi:hypothetical protein
MNMKKVLIMTILALSFSGCKYDDSYLNPKLETMAYFASKSAYTRTVIAGEEMQFKIGAAMSGVLENTNNETVDMIIDKSAALESGKLLLPDACYNSSELDGIVRVTIPAGDFLGYFTVKINAAEFLNDPHSLAGAYVIPVKIVGTSLQSINRDLDHVSVSVTYMSGVDGYYLYRSTIKKEFNGTFVENSTRTEASPNESDNSVFRLTTQSPSTVRVRPAVNSFLNGLAFDLTVNDENVTYTSLPGVPEVTPAGDNRYNSANRDFSLNYKYKTATSDTVYHVSQELIFRNRMVDGINQTREYLIHLSYR